MRLVFARSRPEVALAIGAAMTVGLAVVIVPLEGHITRAVPGLLLVLPVALAAVLGGRVAGFGVAAIATFAFSLALPPLGSPRVRLSEDLIALVVFSVVAFVLSALVTTRVRTLQHIDDQRRALLRSVSHDLRTPLSAIRAVATDLRSGADYDSETRDHLLDIVIDEAERLDRLVANLLSMSRIEAGTMRPTLAPVDLDDLAQSCSARLARLFSESRLTVSIPPGLPLVDADRAQVEQVLNNLLENATRHTPPGTSVTVTAASTPRTVEITITDDGPGISSNGRAGRSRQSSEGSTGLGLTICRAIVALHHGRLHVDESGPGTRITITLPRTR